MMTPLPQFYAKEIYDALSGAGTDEDPLIEVFCTMNNNELRCIRSAYETSKYNKLFYVYLLFVKSNYVTNAKDNKNKHFFWFF